MDGRVGWRPARLNLAMKLMSACPLWPEIEAFWLAGDLRDDEFEDRFIEDVIVADIGEGTDGWEFNGDSYAVELR
ncbi:hypothetical protein ACIOHS_46885 [Streptomyces sp. NPDC088253]|uniref:hypothetical protein n=1 Tax=Streptomyces sp. NPDC088253 TaxID=3365846 RepID=UPI00380565DB